MNMNTEMNVLNNSYLRIDTDRVRANVRTIIQSLPAGVKLIPVLKDDAYGMGMVGMARTLSVFPELDMLAVAHVSEGVTLRREGIRQDILVMGGVLPFQYAAALQNDLTLAVSRTGMLGELAALCAEQGRTLCVQIKIETGLHRIGVAPGREMDELIEELKAAEPYIKVTGAFSHFAQAEDEAVSQKQYDLFLKGVAQLEDAGIQIPMRHISGSESTELHPQYSLDAVRIGRRLYMDHPVKPLGGIREAVSWRSYVTHVELRHAGDTLGYGGKFHLPADTLVATIGVGYGDGLNEALAACHAPVLVHGKRCPLLACCMDQSFVDVTGLDVQVGDEVTLFGCDRERNLLSSQEVANLIGDNEGCGLTSALSSRVARLYE